jgi:hypothetical protein
MSGKCYTQELKIEAVKQVNRCHFYSVATRIYIITYSL